MLKIIHVINVRVFKLKSISYNTVIELVISSNTDYTLFFVVNNFRTLISKVG